MRTIIVYEIMHKDRCVAWIDTVGRCEIFEPSFMPYSLYLEPSEDITVMVENVNNFHYWCASRVLTLDRQFAKALLNSAGLMQATTDRDRAKIALTYRCLSLTDVFWIREKGDTVAFADVNLYDNHLDKTFIDIALRGKQYTVQNEYLARDLSTNGCYPKAWRRTTDGFELLKDGGDEAVDRELLASRICRCFDVDQVLYEESTFDDERVTVSKNFTSSDYSIAAMDALDIMLTNQEEDVRSFVLALDARNYYMMNIVDYLIGNTDRHWGNWGVLVNNSTNQPLRLHDLMDFNQSFNAYDTIDGSNCLTGFGVKMTQREAALQAVEKIGLNQLCAVDSSIFERLPQFEEMFRKRLALLLDHSKQKA